MSVYLHDIPLSQAQSRLESALRDADLWRMLGVETIPLDENALGRTLAGPIWAKTSSGVISRIQACVKILQRRE